MQSVLWLGFNATEVSGRRLGLKEQGQWEPGDDIFEVTEAWGKGARHKTLTRWSHARAAHVASSTRILNTMIYQCFRRWIKASLEARASSDATKFRPLILLGQERVRLHPQCQQGAIGNGRWITGYCDGWKWLENRVEGKWKQTACDWTFFIGLNLMLTRFLLVSQSRHICRMFFRDLGGDVIRGFRKVMVMLCHSSTVYVHVMLVCQMIHMILEMAIQDFLSWGSFSLTSEFASNLHVFVSQGEHLSYSTTWTLTRMNSSLETTVGR